jgi:ParB family transcriptional regulator, chromosome partitioning protein
MTKTKPKLVLSNTRLIPFNKLVLSQANVRRVSNGVSIEDLAEDIAHRGLLHNLNVRPVLDDAGAETDMFEIPAGGRRYRALEILVKQKRLPKTAEIPCNVKRADDPISAEEDSLAENTFREALHPLDEFRAIQELSAKGLGDDTIAGRLKITPAVVKQRKRLASVSEKLLAIYGADGMTLEQLMAFTVSEDHARQEHVWNCISDQIYDADPYNIRAMLTEDTVESSDRRARFVGIEDYEAAGGVVMRDLFDNDDGGWLQDLGLLDRLVTEKLKAAAAEIATEGWKWINVAVNFPYGYDSGMQRIAGTAPDLSEADYRRREALRTEHEQIEEQYAQAEELPDDVDRHLGEIEAELEAFENQPLLYTLDDKARAGVFISLTNDGGLRVERGFVRREDEVPDEPSENEAEEDQTQGARESSPHNTVITVGAGEEDDTEEEEEEGGIKPLPDRLVSELTAHRTLALQDAVACHPRVAMTALLYKLCLDSFYHGSYGACLEASVRHVYLPIQAPDLKESASARAIAERQERWKSQLPDSDDALWDHIVSLDDEKRAALLAHCVSLGITALHERADRPGGSGPSRGTIERRIGQADRLADAVALDMVAVGWTPTVENYLGRVTKPRILEAVREAKGEQSAQLIDHLKKGEMAKEAERLLDGTGWLPEPLRLLDPMTGTGEPEALPAFLADEPAAEAAE